MNRVVSSSHPNTICDVVTKPKAFSWYNKEKEYLPLDPNEWFTYMVNKYKDDPVELKALQYSLEQATLHLFDNAQDYTDGANHYVTVDFYNKMETSDPDHWCRTYPVVGIVGDHIFFKK